LWKLITVQKCDQVVLTPSIREECPRVKPLEKFPRRLKNHNEPVWGRRPSLIWASNRPLEIVTFYQLP